MKFTRQIIAVAKTNSYALCLSVDCKMFAALENLCLLRFVGMDDNTVTTTQNEKRNNKNHCE